MHAFKSFAPALILLASCQDLKSGSINIPEYPNVEEVYQSQLKSLATPKVNKEVSLGDKKEKDTIEMDTVKWKRELSFLVDVNPNSPEYVGAFEVTHEGKRTSLKLQEGENGILKHLSITSQDEGYWSLQATIHEDKDIYSYHREVSAAFENDLITNYQIEGYQKMMFRDTVWFSIKGEVLLSTQ